MDEDGAATSPMTEAEAIEWRKLILDVLRLGRKADGSAVPDGEGEVERLMGVVRSRVAHKVELRRWRSDNKFHETALQAVLWCELTGEDHVARFVKREPGAESGFQLTIAHRDRFLALLRAMGSTVAEWQNVHRMLRRRSDVSDGLGRKTREGVTQFRFGTRPIKVDKRVRSLGGEHLPGARPTTSRQKDLARRAAAAKAEARGEGEAAVAVPARRSAKATAARAKGRERGGGGGAGAGGGRRSTRRAAAAAAAAGGAGGAGGAGDYGAAMADYLSLAGGAGEFVGLGAPPPVLYSSRKVERMVEKPVVPAPPVASDTPDPLGKLIRAAERVEGRAVASSQSGSLDVLEVDPVLESGTLGVDSMPQVAGDIPSLDWEAVGGTTIGDLQRRNSASAAPSAPSPPLPY